MGKWMVLMLVVVIMLISTLAFARPEATSPVPDLEGQLIRVVFGLPGSPTGNPELGLDTNGDGELDGVTGWYTAVTPLGSVLPQFTNVPTLLGGRTQSKYVPKKSGDLILRFIVNTRPQRVTDVGIIVGSWISNSGGENQSVKIVATIDATVTMLVKDQAGWHEEPPIWQRHAEGASNAFNFDADIPIGSYNDWPVDIPINMTKPIEQAERTAIEKALTNLLEVPKRYTSKNEPLSVIGVQDGEVIISMGSEDKIKKGDTFAVYVTGLAQTNSWTGEVLDQKVQEVAKLKVIFVQARSSRCEVIDGDIRMVRVGDRVSSIKIDTKQKTTSAPTPKSSTTNNQLKTNNYSNDQPVIAPTPH